MPAPRGRVQSGSGDRRLDVPNVQERSAPRGQPGYLGARGVRRGGVAGSESIVAGGGLGIDIDEARNQELAGAIHLVGVRGNPHGGEPAGFEDTAAGHHPPRNY
jgi:hypothetical protein